MSEGKNIYIQGYFIRFIYKSKEILLSMKVNFESYCYSSSLRYNIAGILRFLIKITFRKRCRK